ncbi:MAG: tautomerase [Phycisphaeraceae bacterium]|nr:MAG: tautomerase [Phycisphaeraceae bacterium]
MPYVNIKITDDGVTPEQKGELIRRVTDALVDVLGKKPEHTHIVIDEVPHDNWGFDGVTTTEYRRRSSPGA